MDKDTSVILRNKKDSKRIRQCRVVFSYKQDHEDELNLNVGDIIDVLGEEEEGWWRGILNGKTGVFPSNFVEEITDKLKSSRENLNSPRENEVTTLSNSKPAKILCEAKYSYKAQNEDELNLKEGDIITLLSKDGQDPGWWKGELNGVVGVFPDNFVIILPHNNNIADRNSDDKSPNNTDLLPKKPASVASQRKSLDINKIQNLTNNIHEKNEANHSDSNKVSPPVPSKKPAIIGIKKSPSSGSGASGLFSGIKKKIVDAVDGATSSKTKTTESNENSNENIFDQVERVPLLIDVRATRAKAPAGRRPPSVVFRDEESGIPNGNSVEPLNLDVVTEQSPGTDADSAEVKPKLREWEKHKAPWLAEMKMNQAKRTSPSPVQAPSTDPKPKSPEIEEVKQKTPEAETVSNSVLKNIPSTPLSTRPKEAIEKVPLRPKPNLTNIPTPRPSSIHQQPTSPAGDAPQKPTRITSPPIPKTERNSDGDMTITFKQYSELLERIHKLELLVEKQNTLHTAAIDELKGKLQLETQIRQMLQVQLDKIASPNVMQV